MSADSEREYLVVNDYGPGGTWIVVIADSAASIEREFPALRVIAPGELEWMTPEIYAEYMANPDP